MKCKLPIVQPLIECYVADASLFSTFVDENRMTGVLNNYIQLVFKLYDERPEYDALMFLDTGYAWKGRGMNWKLYFRDEFLTKQTDIVGFIEEMLCRGYYVIMSLDGYYINTQTNYKKMHYLHDYFIYGFDNKKRIIYMCGYTTKKKFEKFELDYKSFYMSFGEMRVESEPWNNQIQVFNCNSMMHNDLDIIQIRQNLNSYISTEKKPVPNYIDKSSEQTEKFVYGIKIYEVVLNKLEKNRGQIDSRIFRVIWEHKKLFLHRVNAINKYVTNISDRIIVQCAELERISRICFMLGIKYNLTQNVNCLIQISKYIKIMEKNEMETILLLIDALIGDAKYSAKADL